MKRLLAGVRANKYIFYICILYFSIYLYIFPSVYIFTYKLIKLLNYLGNREDFSGQIML